MEIKGPLVICISRAADINGGEVVLKAHVD